MSCGFKVVSKVFKFFGFFFFYFCPTFHVSKSDDKAGLTLISMNLIRNNVSVNRVENFCMECFLLNVNTILTNSLKINTSRDGPVSLFRNSQLKFAVPAVLLGLNGKQTRNNNNQNEMGNSTTVYDDKIKKHNTSGNKISWVKFFKM